MKVFLYTITTICSWLVCNLVSFAETPKEIILPFTVSVDIYPANIKYGDICFARFFATNQNEKAVPCTYGTDFLDDISAELYRDNELLQRFYPKDLDVEFEGLCQSVTIRTRKRPTRILRHNETMLFHLKPVWLPIPEYSRDNLPQNYVILKKRINIFNILVEQGKNNNKFDLKFYFFAEHLYSYHINDKIFNDKMQNQQSGSTIIPEIFTRGQLQNKGYRLSKESSPIINKTYVRYKIEHEIRIIPRSKKILHLIHQWYLEIPDTTNNGEWTGYGLFAHPNHAEGSCSYDTDPNKYKKFFTSMRTRTPELLQRIKRTKELEAELLKLPDSELSQNMKEFIRLRGYLVDLRFAENEREEENVFDNFVTFIDKSKDKELWIRFVDEIAFNSIMDNEHFPYKKIEYYRKRFNKKFNHNINTDHPKNK